MSHPRKRDRAIQALLEEPSVSAAAEAAGLNRRTLQRWLVDDDFRRQLREARSESFSQARSRLCYAANEAVDVLLRGLRGEDIGRMAYWCAKTILEVAEQARDDDLTQRVERLEELARARK